MKTKISHTMQPVTSGNANMNVPSRVSTITTRLVATLSLLITMMGGTVKAADEMVFFHINALGSATAAFNETGDLCWKQHYTPYGEQTNNNDANPPTGCGLIGKDRGYTGHVQDESGLTYMQQRYYDPTIGRFLSVDPVGVSGGNTNTFNRYMYANNNPYKFVDPTGMYIESPLEAASISIGVTSLAYNVSNGNVLASLADVGGLVLDGIGVAIPIVPGVASASIAAYRGTDALASVASKEVKALPAPRRIEASWSANHYRHGGLMTAIEHINYRHGFNSGFANVSRFGKGTSVQDIRSFVDSALSYGNVAENGINGFTVEYNLGRTIGTNSSGSASSSIRVYVRDGNIQTAFPF